MVTVNAIDYDPVIGRFFSPDPFVQIPDFTQSYNRYSYCMNNPVMYNDPEGDFFVVDSWIIGFLSTFGKTWSFKQSLNEANKRAVNDAKIWGGLFVTDPNKSFWGRVGEVVSRLTWQAPQTFAGWFWSQTKNFGGEVDRVDYLGGATFVTNEEKKGIVDQGVTMGSYINIDIGGKIDNKDFTKYVTSRQLYMHEYGHYIQSQRLGPLYLIVVGVTSLNSAIHDKPIPNDPYNASTHDQFWAEYHANRNAADYFGQYYGVTWDESSGFPLYLGN